MTRATFDRSVHDYGDAAAGGAPLSDREFNRIRDLVYGVSRINLSDEKKELVRNRLGKRMRVLGLRSFNDYIDRAIGDSSGVELTHLLNAIATNLTSFFRENKHFEFVSKVFIPEFLKRPPAERETLRAWSAACSTGEEPYSLAMCLLDGLSGVNVDIKILATDLSSRVLETAQTGVYPDKRIAAIAPAYKARYFDRLRDSRVEVKPEVHRAVTFRRLNLAAQRFPFHHRFDLVFCRNVMIYFDRPTQSELVAKLAGCLSRSGYLFLGHSESLTGLSHGLNYVQPTIYKLR